MRQAGVDAVGDPGDVVVGVVAIRQTLQRRLCQYPCANACDAPVQVIGIGTADVVAVRPLGGISKGDRRWRLLSYQIVDVSYFINE